MESALHGAFTQICCLLLKDLVKPLFKHKYLAYVVNKTQEHWYVIIVINLHLLIETTSRYESETPKGYIILDSFGRPSPKYALEPQNGFLLFMNFAKTI